jgi:hypothetical protein
MHVYFAKNGYIDLLAWSEKKHSVFITISMIFNEEWKFGTSVPSKKSIDEKVNGNSSSDE